MYVGAGKLRVAALVAAAMTNTAALASTTPWSGQEQQSGTINLRAGEPAPFDGLLLSPEARDTLASRVENLEAALAEARAANVEYAAAERSRELAITLLQDEIRSLRARTVAATWTTRIVTVGCLAAHLLGRSSSGDLALNLPEFRLANPVPRR